MNSAFFTIVFAVMSLVILTPGVPLKYALLAYFVLIHIDFSGLVFDSAAALGVENAFKIVVLPTVLLIRSRKQTDWSFLKTPVSKAWLFLVSYAVIASFWTPFFISAVKQFGYFYGMTSLVLVLAAYKERDGLITVMILSSLIMAGIQTLMFADMFGTADVRFTSFTAPQGFALSLALLVPIIILAYQKGRSGPLTTMLLLLIALGSIMLNGSRSAVFAVLLLGGWSFIRYWGSRIMLTKIMSASALVMLLVFIFLAGEITSPRRLAALETTISQSRGLQIVPAILGGRSLKTIDTFAFRLGMYATIIEELISSTPGQLIKGHGTSSLGTLITEKKIHYMNFDESTVDANRLAHNEFLRVMYEWGLIGMIAWIILIFRAFTMMREIRRGGMESAWLLGFSFFLLLVFTSFQNIFASTGSPVGFVTAFLFASLFHEHRTMESQRVS